MVGLSSFDVAIMREGIRKKGIVMMTLPCRLSIFAFSVAATLCCHRHTAFGQSPTTPTNIVTKDISCSFGILRIFDANVLINPEDVLEYKAWAAAREYGNGVRASICVDPEYALIGSKIKATIQKRVAEANACNAKQLSSLQAANFSAATANSKLENQALANIRELIAFGKGRAELGDEATEGAEKGAEYLSGIASGGKALKPLAELAQLAGTGGGAAFHFSSEIIAEHIVDKSQRVPPFISSIRTR